MCFVMYWSVNLCHAFHTTNDNKPAYTYILYIHRFTENTDQSMGPTKAREEKNIFQGYSSKFPITHPIQM